MDKFGIFKLLNSFLAPPEQQSTPNPDKKDQPNNLLNDLISSLNNSQTPNSTTPDKPLEEKKNIPLRPLQSSMLSTMSSHDEFIKRVKTNAAKRPPD